MGRKVDFDRETLKLVVVEVFKFDIVILQNAFQTMTIN